MSVENGEPFPLGLRCSFFMKVDGDGGIKFVDMHAYLDLGDCSFIKTSSFTCTHKSYRYAFDIN